MSKPSMQNIPGIGAMTDTLDFVKNLWGGMSIPGMGIPGMIMPTLSVEEINKQVSDLKAVESWLTLNMNMLRSTIQALEVQSATISTLQSMGESLSSAVKSNKPAAGSPAAFSKPATKETEKPEVPSAREAPDAKSSQAEIPAGKGAGGAVPLANPSLWWNMLQDQFKQAVNTAMASEKATSAFRAGAKPAAKSSEPPAEKPAAKKAPVPRSRKPAKPAEK